MDAEVANLVGAEPHQRTAARTTYRNGYRDREWDTRVGTLELQIPKLRQGTYFPSLPEPRRRHKRALLSLVQEAYIHGVSTRAVDNLKRSASRASRKTGSAGSAKSSTPRSMRSAPGASTASPITFWTPPSRRSQRSTHIRSCRIWAHRRAMSGSDGVRRGNVTKRKLTLVRLALNNLLRDH